MYVEGKVRYCGLKTNESRCVNSLCHKSLVLSNMSTRLSKLIKLTENSTVPDDPVKKNPSNPTVRTVLCMITRDTRMFYSNRKDSIVDSDFVTPTC